MRLITVIAVSFRIEENKMSSDLVKERRKIIIINYDSQRPFLDP